MRSAASRTRARSMLPLSRRLSSDAKTGGAMPGLAALGQGQGDEGGH